MRSKNRHQWEPCSIKSEDVNHVDGTVYRAIQCKQCAKCGLKKGIVKIDKWNVTAFHEEGNILSIDTLPFECTFYGRIDTIYEIKRKNKHKGIKQKPNGFLSKEDFYV